MDTSDFLGRALGEDGFYCVFASHATENKRVQNFYTSKDALIAAAEQLDKDGFDTYFALATFQTDNSRKADNAHQFKSFFLDLDCGPGKEYADQSAALSALQKFCV